MADNKVGAIPEFSSDGTQPEGAVEAANNEEGTDAPEVDGQPTRTVDTPETPPEQKPVPSPAEPPPVDDPREKQIQGLESEKAKLLDEIKALRGTRREIKQDQIDKVTTEIDELKDVNPEDTAIVEKILRSKGYIRKDEVSKMHYESVKQDELDSFLEKYPEYRPENDPNDVNWNALQRELGYYRMPDNPKLIRNVLERAHKALGKPATPDAQVQKRRVETAGHGSGGVQTPAQQPDVRTLSAEQKIALKQGGWTDAEIKKMEGK